MKVTYFYPSGWNESRVIDAHRVYTSESVVSLCVGETSLTVDCISIPIDGRIEIEYIESFMLEANK